IVYALSFFKKCKCTFYLLHVNEINGASKKTVATKAIPLQSDQEIKNQLHALVEKIEATSLKGKHLFFTLAGKGTIVETIRDEVEDKHIDLIVMGTKGNSGIKKLAVGSNTTDVINKVKCSTLVIPEKAQFTHIDHLALPTDYSIFFGPRILETVSDILDLFEAKLHVFHLAKSDEHVLGEMLQNKELLEDYFSDNKHEFHTVTNKNLDIAIQECIDAHQIKMITMVAKNIHFFQQLFFSSKNNATTYQNEIPFFVLHD
uniref:universal stress protein n=1 Tax=uncultured Planktosalinus sp. TaxID=1810935 RepID=UPI0030D74712